MQARRIATALRLEIQGAADCVGVHLRRERLAQLNRAEELSGDAVELRAPVILRTVLRLAREMRAVHRDIREIPVHPANLNVRALALVTLECDAWKARR